MFVRNCWKPKSDAEAFDLIEQNPWGLLVSNGGGNEAGDLAGPFATNLQFVLDRARNVLRSHISRANAHTAAMLVEPSQTVLAIFEGPSSYVTASWYPNRDMPPTVYYTSVHCYGKPTLQGEQELRTAVEELTQNSEKDIFNGWKTSDIPEKDVQRRLPHILGFEFQIERIEAKFKLGQDEPKRDALAVAERLLASDNPQDRLLGELTRRYNEHRP